MPRARHHWLDVAKREQAAEGDFGQLPAELGQSLPRDGRDTCTAQVGFCLHHDDRGTDLGEERRTRRIVTVFAIEYEVRGRQVLLADFDPEPFDALARITQAGGVHQAKWKALDDGMCLDRVTRRARNLRNDRPLRAKPRSSCCSARRRCAGDPASMRSAVASAWSRSILPLRTARRVNSPGVARRAPAVTSAASAAAGTSSPPCVEISTTFSPV